MYLSRDSNTLSVIEAACSLSGGTFTTTPVINNATKHVAFSGTTPHLYYTAGARFEPRPQYRL